ncbi:MAG: AAA family ATPase, partial [Eubacteriales bacterium]|nr:AAA family ATPase [Eubacteriales bacterium]
MERENELVDLIDIIGKFQFLVIKTLKYFIPIFILVTALVCTITNKRFVKTYESEVSFAVSREKAGKISYGENVKACDEIFGDNASALTSELMKKTLCNELNEKTLPAKIQAVRIGKTNLFTVKITGRSPEKVEKVMAAFLDNYSKVFRIAMIDADLEIVQEAGMAATVAGRPPYVENVKKSSIVLLVAYFIIMCAYVLLHRTINTEEDVKKHLRSYCLGTLPYVRSAKKGLYPIISHDNSRFHEMKESVSAVRRRIEREAKKSGYKTFVVASSMEGEGSSTISANLAISFSEKGYRTLLLDLDLRKPSQFKNLGLSGDAFDSSTIFDVEMKGYHAPQSSNLDVICTETPSQQALEILTSPNMEEWIAALKKLYDFVIIDTSPVLLVEDAVVLSRVADRCIFVVEQTHVMISDICQAYEMIQQSTGNILGCIL